MDLFDYMRENAMEKESPLASRLRPRTLDEVVGQQHIIGKISCFTGRSKQINWDLLYFMVPQAQERPLLQRSLPIPHRLILSRSMPQ